MCYSMVIETQVFSVISIKYMVLYVHSNNHIFSNRQKWFADTLFFVLDNYTVLITNF